MSGTALQVADMITELKIGNGTSVLITANIASALPASVGAAVQQAADKDSSALPIYALAFFLTTLGVVYVQEVQHPQSLLPLSQHHSSASGCVCTMCKCACNRCKTRYSASVGDTCACAG